MELKFTCRFVSVENLGHGHRVKLVEKAVPLRYTCYFLVPNQKHGAETRQSLFETQIG